VVCQLCEDRWLQAGFELAPNIASAAPPQVRSASPRHRACDRHASLGRELNLDRTAGSGGAPSTVADMAQWRLPQNGPRHPAAVLAQTRKRGRPRGGQDYVSSASTSRPSRARRRHLNNWLADSRFAAPSPTQAGPAIALRHNPVLLFQRPTAPGTRRDNVKPRGLRNRRMLSHTPMSSPRQHIRQGGLRRKNMSKSDICAIKWSPFRGAPKRRIARS
jgi:hypothetical protein